MPKCIYCKNYNGIECFSNREHVIPQAFGNFTPDNLILNRKGHRIKHVCNDCNNDFSKFEIWLAKDTFEGYVGRHKHGEKGRNIDKSKSNRRRVHIVVREGDYKGVHVWLNENCAIELLPQIGFQKKNGDWDYFLLEAVKKINTQKYSLEKNSLRAFCLSNNQAKEIFNQVGINFVKKGDLPKPPEKDVLCEIKSKVDKVIRRSIAKIAFNFFAYFNYKYIVLDKAFDEIRQFVLNGENEIPMRVEDEPILADEYNCKFRKLGHIITINKNSSDFLTAQVSLFNHLKYTVLLAERFIHKKLKFGFGRYFDIGSKKILNIQKRYLIIPQVKLLVPQTNIWLPKK